MHRIMYFSVRDRSSQEKYKNKKIFFPGFDGNYETKQLAYTLWFIFRLDRFDELKKRIHLAVTIRIAEHLEHTEKCLTTGIAFQIKMSWLTKS